jgi:hypothetical protein
MLLQHAAADGGLGLGLVSAAQRAALVVVGGGRW